MGRGSKQRTLDANGRPMNAKRMGGRILAKEAASLTPVGRKYSPERMTALLNRLIKFPHVTNACRFSGIEYSTLRYWLLRSMKGQPGDGWDLDYGEEKKRFHEHFEDVRDAAVQMVEDEFFNRAAFGYYEVLSDRGRVIYQTDPELEALGLTGPAAWRLDEDGKPTPERIHHQDPEVQLAVLRQWRRDRWGVRETHDHRVQGGVLVVHDRAANSVEHDAEEQALLTKPIDVEFREVEDE